MIDLHAGWYLIAFTDELDGDLTPIRLGDKRLMIVRTDDEQGYGLFDSTCPHRGADLAYGGELKGNCVVCPFHGRRIVLGESERPWKVRSYPTLVFGPLVFARLTDQPEGESTFTEKFPLILGDRTITPAVNRGVRVPVEYVVENAFDVEHFAPVHEVPGVADMRAGLHEDGYLQIGGDFVTVQNPWIDMRMAVALQKFLGDKTAQSAQTRTGFRATAFSPTVVATSFGSTGHDPVIITAAVPTEQGCHVRVAVAGSPDDPVEHIVNGSVLAIKQDLDIWEHLDPQAPAILDERDANVIAYRRFCDEFPRVPDTVASGKPFLLAAEDVG